MTYAEVAVHAPVGYDRTLSYGVPQRFSVEPGQMVWAPLGSRPVQGVVFQLAEQPQVEVTRDLIAPLEPSPLVSPVGLELARWLSSYYLCSLFDAVALMLPPGFQSLVRSYLTAPSADPRDSSVTVKGEVALEHLSGKTQVRESELVKLLGKDGERELRRLLARGLVRRGWELPRPRASHRYNCYLRTAATDTAQDAPNKTRAPKQEALMEVLSQDSGLTTLAGANKEFGPAAVRGLIGKGLVGLDWMRVDREPPIQQRDYQEEIPLVLTPEQRSALTRIIGDLDGSHPGRSPFLLHGVTGSGKTEVYLRALAHCIEKGYRGIYLVPEIALTPQTMHRLNTRFPGRVAVMHSRLTPGEQFDQWWRIRDGDYDVVVGPRSALFAPLPDLGLIVIDEEHEWTYKQQDVSPRYHVREVALKLAKITQAAVVMGSATPDVETYYRAEQGRFRTLDLPYRIAASDGPEPRASELAQVQVCDMRRELKDGNRSIFSRALAGALEECIDRGEQALLFLNRRGAATVVQCRDCGSALRCGRCSVALTYHALGSQLLCHQCNRRSRVPRGCPGCRSPRIRYLGLGTQRVVEELESLAPRTVVLRWDRDAARDDRSHDSILQRFLRGEAQILVGTQMVAKGLHMPGVSLVGVILADIGLNLPDFRAGERAFQLLCQVAGRAGRGTVPGRVIVQTYTPDNYAIEAAASQSYQHFYAKEIEFRRNLANPPFSRLAHLVLQHTNAEACQREAERMGRVLRRRANSLGLPDVEVIGPAPAFPARVRGRYRWHLVLRGRDLHPILERVGLPQGWTVDVDPVSVL